MAQTSYPDGKMELFNDNGVLKCSMPFVSGTFQLNVNGPCNSNTWDDVASFTVVGVPSASTFTLYDDEYCRNRTDQAYIYTFKVVKNPTTTPELVLIESAGVTEVGQLVHGTTLRMEYKLRNRDARDLLGCVRIVRSDVPQNNKK
ncbi:MULTISPECIES: hypothetical protein [Pseudomonas]|uniref:hypothetical protein n=1 Tax=Pseudomonas TaxID=286 RepID=UPI00200A3900|nr:MULTISPECIES: hypothetical protein [Pseudomonas]MCK8659379.1 hypothetical protein [Pseudomonas umsongensis]